jgi:hypothetical protein
MGDRFKIVLDGREVLVRGTRTGRVEFRYPDDAVWFSLDGFEHTAKDVLTRLSPTALRTIADVKEARHV